MLCYLFCTFTKCIVCLHLEPGDCNEGTVRLVNGTLTREGRLEVCVNGVWGNVCANNFRKSAAYVACKQSGFSDVNGKYHYIQSEGKIFILIRINL